MYSVTKGTSSYTGIQLFVKQTGALIQSKKEQYNGYKSVNIRKIKQLQ